MINEYVKHEADDGTLKVEIAERERRIAKLEREIGNLTASLAEGVGTSAIRLVYQQIEQRDLESGALRREVAELRAKEREAESGRESAKENAARIRDLVQAFDNLQARERNTVVMEVVKGCVWDGETLFLEL